MKNMNGIDHNFMGQKICNVKVLSVLSMVGVDSILERLELDHNVLWLIIGSAGNIFSFIGS